MTNFQIEEILKKLENHDITADEAYMALRSDSYADIDYAKVDLDRRIRTGVTEVIYGQGKTWQQISGIVKTLIDNGQEPILITRLSEDKYKNLEAQFHMTYNERAHIALVGQFPQADGIGKIVIATGGTSDIPVAEEAAFTAEALGNEVVRLYDVGVAGIHRLLDNSQAIMDATVVIAIAGMEGALASVVGGMADCPVIAVPTSVGYGAAFEGLSALLSMLNSCASGVSVVNIDNGFGAGYQAHMINHVK